MSNISTGKLGEYFARKYLLRNGFLIKAINARTKLGEIDIVAIRNKVVHFVEVKTRVGEDHGKPYEAVNYYKLRHMLKSAQYYVLQNNLNSHKLSLDVVSIILFPDQTIREINFYENITL